MKSLAVALALVLGSTQVATADRLAEAKQHFVVGKAAHDAGRYDEAIKEYQAAYDLAPLPELLFNLGQVYRLKGDKRKALDHYAKYLVVAPKGPVAAEARQWQAQLEKEVAAEPEPVPDPVEPTPVEPAPVEPAPAPVMPPGPEPRGSGGSRLKTGAYVASGIGVLAAIGAIKLGLDARAASDDVSTVDDGRWDQADNDRVAAGERAETLSIVATGVAAAAITTGVVLYVMGARAERSTSMAFVPREGGGVLSLGARF